MVARNAVAHCTPLHATNMVPMSMLIRRHGLYVRREGRATVVPRLVDSQKTTSLHRRMVTD
jgi:hypothetical protein